MMNHTLPTLYEHYTSGGISSGLSTNQSYFQLNNRNITIYSGSIHYFRVPRPYWRDRLRKMRAAGLNTIDTCIPWNLHEPKSGSYDFGNGGSDFEDFLDIKEFLNTVKEEDLFAIVRPGPYIGAEWEFGGLPSWLLREKDIKLGTSQRTFMKYVARYFSVLLPILAMLQFAKGGPIIAFQVENKHETTGIKHGDYLLQLRDLMKRNQLVELLMTSNDFRWEEKQTLPSEFFQTVKFGSNPELEMKLFKALQPGKPIMVMEFSVGWFSQWGGHHGTVLCEIICPKYEYILKQNASINIYMFHGGTNFGFMNGANMNRNNDYRPGITSNDYDAPLTERGDYTTKYFKIKKLLKQYNPVQTRIPKMPKVWPAVTFPRTEITDHIPIYDVINNASKKYYCINVLPMEELHINNSSGQSYGYIVYRKTNLRIYANSVLTISGYIRDTVMVLLNGKLVSKPLLHASDLDGFGYWKTPDSNLTLTHRNLKNVTLDLIVENLGRVNRGDLNSFKQFKGLQNKVHLSGVQLVQWQVIPLEFKKDWIEKSVKWNSFHKPLLGPTLYRALIIPTPEDTFLDMRLWTKGIVIINGFVLGRYAKIDPQKTLYIPAPFLKEGINTIVVFEHFFPDYQLIFSNKHLFDFNSNDVYFEQNGADGRSSLYKTIGIGIFLINNVAMVTLYVMFKRRGRW